MLTRRSLLVLGALFGAALPAGQPKAETLPSVMTDDGLHSQSWFLESFLDLSEDLEEAAGEGKGFAITFNDTARRIVEGEQCPAVLRLLPRRARVCDRFHRWLHLPVLPGCIRSGSDRRLRRSNALRRP